MVRFTKQANFTLDKNTIKALAIYSAKTGRSKSSIVDIAVIQYIMDHKEDKQYFLVNVQK